MKHSHEVRKTYLDKGLAALEQAFNHELPHLAKTHLLLASCTCCVVPFDPILRSLVTYHLPLFSFWGCSLRFSLPVDGCTGKG